MAEIPHAPPVAVWPLLAFAGVITPLAAGWALWRWLTDQAEDKLDRYCKGMGW